MAIGLLGWPVSESGRLGQGAGGLGATDGATAPPDGANVVYALRSVPNIGPVAAAAFVAAVDDAARFRRAHEVEVYLGLVPRDLSSGETQRRGRITMLSA